MPNRYKQILVITILVSVILRIAMSFYLGNEVVDFPGTADQISYHNLALRVLEGHGFTFGQPWWPATPANAQTAHWSFLYTGYLVFVYALFGPNPLIARLIQAVLVGILQPLLAYWIGRRLFGEAVGLAAAILTGLYAYFIYYSAALMTEPFYIVAIMGSFYIGLLLISPAEHPSGAHTGRSLVLALAFGLTLGAAVLLRQLFLLLVPFYFLWILFDGWKRLPAVLASGAVIAILILPFTIFNYARFHRFVLLNTNSGFAFFWGNNPIYGTQFQPILPSSEYRDMIPPELLSLDEASLDQALLSRGIQFVLNDPVRYVKLSISRIPAYFMFWPSSGSGTMSNIARVASFGVLWPFMLYGLLRSFKRRPSPFSLRPPSLVLMLYVFVLVYTAIHVLTWTLIRYRLPVDAVLIIFAGLAFVDIIERIPALRRLFSFIAQTESRKYV
ncbi:MAG TPA: glycosyltransferase family 39 protein [Anaerolineales bacterium]